MPRPLLPTRAQVLRPAPPADAHPRLASEPWWWRRAMSEQPGRRQATAARRENEGKPASQGGRRAASRGCAADSSTAIISSGLPRPRTSFCPSLTAVFAMASEPPPAPAVPDLPDRRSRPGSWAPSQAAAVAAACSCERSRVRSDACARPPSVQSEEVMPEHGTHGEGAWQEGVCGVASGGTQATVDALRLRTHGSARLPVTDRRTARGRHTVATDANSTAPTAAAAATVDVCMRMARAAPAPVPRSGKLHLPGQPTHPHQARRQCPLRAGPRGTRRQALHRLPPAHGRRLVSVVTPPTLLLLQLVLLVLLPSRCRVQAATASGSRRDPVRRQWPAARAPAAPAPRCKLVREGQIIVCRRGDECAPLQILPRTLHTRNAAHSNTGPDGAGGQTQAQ
jgi:hypothetical protein